MLKTNCIQTRLPDGSIQFANVQNQLKKNKIKGGGGGEKSRK